MTGMSGMPIGLASFRFVRFARRHAGPPSPVSSAPPEGGPSPGAAVRIPQGPLLGGRTPAIVRYPGNLINGRGPPTAPRGRLPPAPARRGPGSGFINAGAAGVTQLPCRPGWSNQMTVIPHPPTAIRWLRRGGADALLNRDGGALTTCRSTPFTMACFPLTAPAEGGRTPPALGPGPDPGPGEAAAPPPVRSGRGSTGPPAPSYSVCARRPSARLPAPPRPT